jgi:hypothetical protein
MEDEKFSTFEFIVHCWHEYKKTGCFDAKYVEMSEAAI